MQTLVKLTLRLTTKVTTSPTCRRRSSSATRVRACKSRPRAVATARPSSTDTSAPSRARLRTRRTSAVAASRTGRRLPASPVLMGLLDEAVGVDQIRDPRPEWLGDELGMPRELRIDSQALAQDEALALGRPSELRDSRPRLLGIDVVEGERRDAAPVIQARRQQASVGGGREIGRRLDVHVRAEHEPGHRERAEQIVE